MNATCSSRSLIYLIIIIALAFLFYSLANFSGSKPEQVDISKVVDEVKNNQVDKITVNGNKLTVNLKNNGQTQVAYKEENVSLTQYGIVPDKVNIDIANTSSSTIWVSILSGLLPVIIIAGIIYLMLRQAQGANMRALSFGKSSARVFGMGQTKITFNDVAGLEEAKQELVEVVQFLKEPGRFRKLGAEIPKGVMLLGPPGCGKTLLAKAVAGEAGVPFFSISGSEFVEMFVGVGASRVRDLFNRAKKNAPCIIFIDEIDAVGRQRGAGLGGSHDEREQTLNQILVEMDGFETDTNVIVVAATNRPDVLDPALLRPGRFDRRVVLDLPDKNERIQILKVHAKDKPLDSSADLERVAAQTVGFSGADLKNLLNEAAILAARENKKTITSQETSEAVEKVMLGPERKSRMLSPHEKEITAFHETGHALVAKILPLCDPVHKISIVSRGLALGYTWNLPAEDRHIHSRSKFEQDLTSLLGGRAAEKFIFNELTTGAENDLRKATRIAKKMIKEFGMSDKLGPVTFGEKEELVFLGRELGEQKNYSEEIAARIDQEIQRIITEAENKAYEILSKHEKTLRKIAKILIRKETIEAEEFDKLFDGRYKKDEDGV